jgi:hypothetical protein
MNKVKVSYLSVFWFVAFIAVIGFLITTSLALFSVRTHEFCTSYSCINFLFSKVLLVPLAIIATALPITGILLALHRSGQTQAQIQQTKHHNIVNNYFMHKREFVGLCSELENIYEIKIDSRKIYLELFPNNGYEQVEFVYNFERTLHITNFFQWGEEATRLGKKMSRKDYEFTFDDVHFIIRHTNYTALKLGIKYSINSPQIEVILNEKGAIASYQLVSQSLYECWTMFFNIAGEFGTFTKSSPYFTELKYITKPVDDFIENNKGFKIITPNSS